MKSKNDDDQVEIWQSDEKNQGQIEYKFNLLNCSFFLDQNCENNLTTGTSLWLSSEILSFYLQFYYKKIPKNGKVIELGSGIGLISLLLERIGWKNIISTDIEPCLSKVLIPNIKRNSKGGITIKELDWTKFNSLKDFKDSKEFDLIISSDTIYESCLIEGFWNTLKILLKSKKNSKAILAIERRDSLFINQSFDLARKKFNLITKLISKHQIRKAITKSINVKIETLNDAIERIEIWQIKL